MKKKALIAMSGGVDSSVAAALMVREGYECIGCTMKLLDQNDENLMDAVTGVTGDAPTCQTGTAQANSTGDTPAGKTGTVPTGITGGASTNKSGTAQANSTGDTPAGRTISGVSQKAEGKGLGSDRPAHTCCSLDDVEDARSVARKMGMPYYVFNFSEDFGEKVIDRFVRIYQAGGTPNPCIDCNRYMKFDRLFHRAQVLGCDVVVTGHYARIRFDDKTGRWQLLRSKNRDKDQTYVLYSMTQEQLSHTAFPLGEYSDKEEVRRMADAYGFVNSHKPDSQDICFVQNGKYADFIEKRTGKQAQHGYFVDEEGHVLGEHKGLIRYTIGQRRGLGLALPAPLYVCRIDTQKNQVVLTPEDRLFSRRLIAEDFNWIWAPIFEADASRIDAPPAGYTCEVTTKEADASRNDTPPVGYTCEVTTKEADASRNDTPPVGYTCEVTAKPRYRAKEAAATARVLDGGKVEIVFHEPQRALTVGQAVVLYMGEIVVGGGTIAEVPQDP